MFSRGKQFNFIVEIFIIYTKFINRIFWVFLSSKNHLLFDKILEVIFHKLRLVDQNLLF